jgi:dTDP-glucose 4,6-dehydratase
MKDSVMITGGAGFIGSNFIKYFMKAHPEVKVINIDKLTYCGKLSNIKEAFKNENYSFFKADICDFDFMDNLMKECYAVIHFAAESHVDNSIKEPFIFTKTNVMGTHTLLEAARNNKIEKFLYVSSDEVYGSIAEGLFTEDSPFKPNSPYSASKAAADLLVQAYHKTYGLPTLITRSSNNFGPNQFPEKMMPLFITNLIQDKKVPLYGKGMNVRDWLYVEDNCSAIDIVFQKGVIGEAYNIGGGVELTNIELTRKILKLMDKDESLIEYVTDRLGHDLRYGMDCSKIKELGFVPEKDFDNQLIKTIKWYQDNKDWWKK